MMGGGVGEGLEGADLVIALVTGVVLLTAMASVQGVLGQATGLSLARLTAGPLGVEGSRRTASVVMLAMMLGWFGVNVGVAGVALARLVGLPDVVGVVAFAAIMLAVAGRGLGVLSWSATIAGRRRWSSPPGACTSRSPTGPSRCRARPPAATRRASSRASCWWSATARRSRCAPDFTHDLARPRQVVWCALVGLAAPVVVFALAGAALHAATTLGPRRRPARPRQPELAYLFVAVGFTGSVLTNIWSGGLSLDDVLRACRAGRPWLVVAAAGTCLAAAGFDELMLPGSRSWRWRRPASSPICAIHVVPRRTSRSAVGNDGLACWGVGFACGLALLLAGSPLALPGAAVVPAIAYWVLGPTGERKLGEREGLEARGGDRDDGDA